MTTLSKDLHQVETLTESQIAQFKRDGMLVLPEVLDPDLCGKGARSVVEFDHGASSQYEAGRSFHLGPVYRGGGKALRGAPGGRG